VTTLRHPSPDPADPTYRINRLAAANKPPLSVKPDAPLREATTLMLANDYSQLPVMTTEREVKGVVSWTSVGTRLALGRQGEHVRDAMDPHFEIRAEASLIQAIPIIAEHQYVLVRNSADHRINGIVTATDLSLQFHQLAEPFLVLGDIENHLRRIIADKLPTGDLAAARSPAEGGRPVNGVEDLTFGEYLTLMGNSDRWNKLGLAIDRHAFCSQLNRIREIRNTVMHFDPDGIESEDLDHLRDFARFLERLRGLGDA
jgi:hypothetical protein